MRLAIRVKPGSSRTAVGGRYDGGRYDGGQDSGGQRRGGQPGGALIVAVSARAVDGRATEAALRAVADAFGVRRRDVSLVAGATSRDKVVEIVGDEGGLAALRETLLGVR